MPGGGGGVGLRLDRLRAGHAAVLEGRGAAIGFGFGEGDQLGVTQRLAAGRIGPAARCRDTQNQSETITSSAPAWSATLVARVLANGTTSSSKPVLRSSPWCLMTSSSQATVPNTKGPYY